MKIALVNENLYVSDINSSIVDSEIRNENEKQKEVDCI